MTASGRARWVVRGPRQELTLVLLLGAVGAGLVLLASRQGWAHVQTAAPRPLPPGVTSVSGQALVPATGALAVAALAGLAAVLATRRALRRVAGVALAAFGAGIIAAVSTGISAASVLAAATASQGNAAGTGGASAGSTTAGSTAGGSTTGGTGAGSGSAPLSGFPAHVTFVSFPWRALAVAGAIAIIAAGVLVTLRADRLPVMSARFDRPPRAAGQRGRPGPAGQPSGGPGDARQAGSRQPGQSADPAAMWEALSRGEDPTSRDGQTGQRNPARLE
jgi:uncharacterized membrane protein (TIGR02234 family)